MVHQNALGGFASILGVGSGGTNPVHSFPISNIVLSSGMLTTFDRSNTYSDVGRRSSDSPSLSSSSVSSQSGAGRHPSSSTFLAEEPTGSSSRDDELLTRRLKTFCGGLNGDSGAVRLGVIRGKLYESQLGDERVRPCVARG